MITCKSCELVARRDRGEAPLWDCIHRTSFWDVAHCYETCLPGWLVLVARRHMASLAELTEPEAVELGSLIRSISRALQQVTRCQKIYVLQFAESPEHPHVHFHLIPRMPDLPAEYRATRIFRYLGVPEAQRLSEAEMNAIAMRLRERLQQTMDDGRSSKMH